LKPELQRVCPGLLGGHEWNGGAYSPRLHALFMPATDWCRHIKPDAETPNPQGQNRLGQYFGGKFEFEPWDNAPGLVSAFDDATGKTL
jgi:alcohol dehydrogenase (cytochrome c)